jgi:hypothetical protein
MAMSAVALFSFAATSFHSDVGYALTYVFDGPPAAFAERRDEKAWLLRGFTDTVVVPLKLRPAD